MCSAACFLSVSVQLISNSQTATKYYQHHTVLSAYRQSQTSYLLLLSVYGTPCQQATALHCFPHAQTLVNTKEHVRERHCTNPPITTQITTLATYRSELTSLDQTKPPTSDTITNMAKTLEHNY